MEEISKTGFWNGETAHIHHVHSVELSNWICNFLKDNKDKRVYDFGCGLGNYLKDLKDDGFTDLVGYEGDIPKNKVFSRMWEQDLTVPITDIYEKGNVISLEVGEHLPSEFQDIFIDNITNACDNYLITSWAIRGQAGFGHVNCLDNHEIIPEFEKRGFKYLPEESLDARSVIQDYCAWFRNTLLIFKKV